jgi:hypothetical protein
MATWAQVSAAQPEFAARVQERFQAYKHKTLATLRKDGSPRISGIEATFTDDELWFGSMPGALKALDLRRDPRFALHGPSVDSDPDDPSAWGGDAKLSGLAVEVTDRAEIEAVFRASGVDADVHQESHLFQADIQEVVLTRIGEPADHLVIELWREGESLRRFERT